MLRGNLSAKIDDKFGVALFVTSLTGESVRIYPMSVWIGIEEKLARIPSTHPSRSKFFDRVNFYGQPAELDKQGRVSVHTRLREAAGMVGDVDVFGLYDYLEVWNHDRFLARLEREPFTDDDARALADFGI